MFVINHGAGFAILHLRIKIEPATAAADETIYVPDVPILLYLTSSPSVTGSGFYAEIQIILGTVRKSDHYFTLVYKIHSSHLLSCD